MGILIINSFVSVCSVGRGVSSTQGERLFQQLEPATVKENESVRGRH
jgi:ATP-dependent DNA ligase